MSEPTYQFDHIQEAQKEIKIPINYFEIEKQIVFALRERAIQYGDNIAADSLLAFIHAERRRADLLQIDIMENQNQHFTKL